MKSACSTRRRLPLLLRAGLAAGALAIGTATVSLAADEPAGEPGDNPQNRRPQSALELVQQGGPPLILLGVCSLATVTLIIERAVYYRRARGDSRQIVGAIKQAGTVSQALAAIERAPGVPGRVFRSALVAARDGYPPEQIEQLAQSDVTQEQLGLERYLPQLDTFVTMCPLIGLAGTTLGMIKSFSIVAVKGFENPNQLAGGISEALVNTAAGLLIAIPALFAYNWFTGRKEALLMELERGLTQLLVILRTSAPR